MVLAACVHTRIHVYTHIYSRAVPVVETHAAFSVPGHPFPQWRLASALCSPNLLSL